VKSEKYQAESINTESRDYHAIRDRLQGGRTIRLLHGALGLVTESGEFADVLKKHIFYGKPIDEVNLSEEVGDLFWYCAIIADALGEDFGDIMARNVAKLRARYPDKFTEYDALHRYVDAERTILETREVAKHAPEVEDWPEERVEGSAGT
jgi:NTP pyrophosphatase (non-canonical NTP hydrolase)